MDKEEFKRLERAYNKANKKNKTPEVFMGGPGFNKQALIDWGIQFEETMMEKLRKEYEQKYKDELSFSIDCFIVAIAYTLHGSEKTRFGAKRLNEFLDDMQSTVDLFYTREYSPQEYINLLKEDGIILNIIKNKEKEKDNE